MTEFETFLKEAGFSNGIHISCPSRDFSEKIAHRKNVKQLRETISKKYGFAVLTGSMIERIKPYQPFLEIGAGLGYWAYEFIKNNVDYVATDLCIDADNYFFKGIDKRWVEVKKLSAEDALKLYPDHTLLLCWPGSSFHRSEWAYNALTQYKGDVFIYVGEPHGGNCAENKFFNCLEDNWTKIETLDMPSLWDLREIAQIFRRLAH